MGEIVMDYKFGDVVLAEVQYTDTFDIKKRPSVVLFEEMGNIIVAGITSNLKMKGILLTKSEGLPKDSVIKLNYIFTVHEKMIKRFLLQLSKEKKEKIRQELISKISK
jgi:mRNA interferase MazF